MMIGKYDFICYLNVVDFVVDIGNSNFYIQIQNDALRGVL